MVQQLSIHPPTPLIIDRDTDYAQRDFSTTNIMDPVKILLDFLMDGYSKMEEPNFMVGMMRHSSSGGGVLLVVGNGPISGINNHSRPSQALPEI